VVVYELVRAALDALAGVVGLEGIAIGALAAVVVVLWYLHEFAGVLMLMARYSRTAAVVGALVLALLVAGTATGTVEFGGEASLFNQLSEVLH